jgi:hypothetical protein
MTAVETSNTESETGSARISDMGTKKQVAGRACRSVASRRNCPLNYTNLVTAVGRVSMPVIATADEMRDSGNVLLRVSLQTLHFCVTGQIF